MTRRQLFMCFGVTMLIARGDRAWSRAIRKVRLSIFLVNERGQRKRIGVYSYVPSTTAPAMLCDALRATGISISVDAEDPEFVTEIAKGRNGLRGNGTRLPGLELFFYLNRQELEASIFQVELPQVSSILEIKRVLPWNER